MFGLSNASTILQNLGCNGTEYSFNECPGYDLMALDGPYCQSGNYQAGVRCIEGKYLITRHTTKRVKS